MATTLDVERIRRDFPLLLLKPGGKPLVYLDSAATTQKPQCVIDTVTECCMGDNLAAQFPEREMLRLCSLRCRHMNMITLADTLACLQKVQYKIELSEDIIERARIPIDRMLAIT